MRPMSEARPISHYDVLGIKADASLDEIKTAYRARIAEYHPDRNRSPHAHAYTALINDAWETLRDPQRRREYNARIGETESPQQPRSSNSSPQSATPPSKTRSVWTPWFAIFALVGLLGAAMWYAISP